LLNQWKYGLRQLSQFDLDKLGFPEGVLFDVVPSEASHDSIIGMQKVLYMVQNYPGLFSFEIWKDKKFSFHFFSSSKSAEGMLQSQLLSVYPQSSLKRSKTNLPLITEGEYVSSSSVKLIGSELNLRCPDDFHYDPLRHLIEAMKTNDSKTVVQVIFERVSKIPKGKKVVLTQKYGDDLFFRDIKIPLVRCLVRVCSISNKSYKAFESMEHVARTFSIFDSDRCQLVPDIRYFPLLKNSLKMLSNMNRRKFPTFSKSFLVSVPELASLVHLPTGGIPGLDYVQPSLSPSNFSW
jgi:hypothetical protein